MYSVVLMMAMTGAPENPAFLFRKGGCDGGCHGCSGCYGGCTGYSCGGGCYGGCSGCNGCHGGGGLFGKKRNHGCCGCCGGGYGGCYGGCTGYVECGCCGGGYGGCTGCWGGGYSMPMGGAPMGTPMPPTAPKPETGPKPMTMTAAPATMVVNLPADATLKVDGHSTQATSDLRTFATPVLPVGQDFHYTLTAAIVRDGKTLTTTQQVTVRGGLTSQVNLPAAAFGQAVVMK
jgi:uncharacterized protein (TIGR03000 family)